MLVGMEVVKVSDRKVYFPSDLSDQSKSTKFKKAIKGEDYISQVYTSDSSPAIHHGGDSALGRGSKHRGRGGGRSRLVVSLGSDWKDSFRHCGLRVLSRRAWKSNRP